MRYDRSGRNWTLSVNRNFAGKVYVNGSHVRKRIELRPGDVVSSLEDSLSPKSFGLHIEVPKSGDAPPLDSVSFSRNLIRKGFEALPRYHRVIAIMGAQIRPDGSLGPILERRVLEAVQLYKSSWAEGVPTVIIPTGGEPTHYIRDPLSRPRNESGGPLTEAQAMAKALAKFMHRENVAEVVPDPDEHVILEDKARDTISNGLFVRLAIESPENRSRFVRPNIGPTLDLRVLVERLAHTRFRKAFGHVFRGADVQIRMEASPSIAISDEGELHKGIVRRSFYDETTAGDVDSIATHLRTKHTFFIGEPREFFEIPEKPQEAKPAAAKPPSALPTRVNFGNFFKKKPPNSR